MNGNIFIEHFCKKRGGKEYRTVRISVRGAVVEIGDLLCRSDEEAIKKVAKYLEDARKEITP